jgi:hypothetical protein
MTDASTRRPLSGDVYLVLSADEAGHVLEALVRSLHAGAWAGDTLESMTALALFLRDYLSHPIEVPAMAPERSESRAAA